MKKKKAEAKKAQQKTSVVKEVSSADIKFKDGGAVLVLDGKEFLLKHNDLLRLINAFSPGAEPLRTEDFRSDDEFQDLNTLENTAKLHCLMNLRKTSPPKVAEMMEIPKDRFIAWLNNAQAKKERQGFMNQKPAFSEAVEKYDKETFPEDHKKKKSEMKTFDPKKVAKLFGENNSIDYVCKKLKTTKAKFLPYFQLHMKEINKYIRMAAEDRVLNEYMREMEEQEKNRK